MIIVRILPAADGKRKPRGPSDERDVQPEPTPARLR